MSAAAPALSLFSVRKSYGDHRAVSDVSLDIARGTLLTLLGPSGCGKSTLLRMIAGFVVPSGGEIRINGRNVTGMAPEKRPTAMVFQSYALFPHMTVFDNVAFGLRVRRTPRAAARRQVDDALALVKMSGFAGRYPSELSGGQQQRVALARCLVVRPEILLLDEPFGALDRGLREAMQVELRKLQRHLSITMLVVTHDQQEALVLSDHVAVMNAGEIEQFAPPAMLYDRPATRFVADFMGVSNILSGTVDRHGATTRFLPDVGGAIAVPEDWGGSGRDRLHLAVRPETLRLVGPDDPRATLRGAVVFTSMVGSQITCEIKIGETSIIAAVQRSPEPVAVGSTVGIVFDPAHVVALSR